MTTNPAFPTPNELPFARRTIEHLSSLRELRRQSRADYIERKTKKKRAKSGSPRKPKTPRLKKMTELKLSALPKEQQEIMKQQLLKLMQSP